VDKVLPLINKAVAILSAQDEDYFHEEIAALKKVSKDLDDAVEEP
jgi:hypothetical protein